MGYFLALSDQKGLLLGKKLPEPLPNPLVRAALTTHKMWHPAPDKQSTVYPAIYRTTPTHR